MQSRWYSIGTAFKGSNIVSFNEYANIFPQLTDVPLEAFNGSKLAEITLNEGLRSVSNSSFRSTKLVNITLPTTVTTIGAMVWFGTSTLRTITCLAVTPPSLGASSVPNNVTAIYVPRGSVDSYKTSWSSLASKIMAIPE